MERQMRISEDVLRFMTVRVEELESELTPHISVFSTLPPFCSMTDL
jgi:ribosomal protein S6